jgi:uncharacterized protein
MRLVDAHVHFFSHRFFSLLAGQARIADGVTGVLSRLKGWDEPPEDPAALAHQWIGELDRCHVSRANIIASMPGDESSVAAAVQRYPGRFTGSFMYNPAAPDGVRTLESALESGLRCAAFFPAMHGYRMTDPSVEAAVKTLGSRAGTAAFVHCGILSVGVRKRLGLKSEFDVKLSNPVDLHELALRNPQLPFIIPHFGAGYFREALMVAASSSNVYLDTSSTNSWMAIEGLTLRDVFQRALGVVGASRLLFGTDSSFFPRGWNESIYDGQIQVMNDLNVPPSDLELVFGGNFERIFQESAR